MNNIEIGSVVSALSRKYTNTVWAQHNPSNSGSGEWIYCSLGWTVFELVRDTHCLWLRVGNGQWIHRGMVE